MDSRVFFRECTSRDFYDLLPTRRVRIFGLLRKYTSMLVKVSIYLVALTLFSFFLLCLPMPPLDIAKRNITECIIAQFAKGYPMIAIKKSGDDFIELKCDVNNCTFSYTQRSGSCSDSVMDHCHDPLGASETFDGHVGTTSLLSWLAGAAQTYGVCLNAGLTWQIYWNQLSRQSNSLVSPEAQVWGESLLCEFDSAFPVCPFSIVSRHSSNDCPIDSNICKFIRSWICMRDGKIHLTRLDLIRKTAFVISFANFWGLDITLDRTRNILLYLNCRVDGINETKFIQTVEDLINSVIAEEVVPEVFDIVRDRKLELKPLFEKFLLHFTAACPGYPLSFADNLILRKFVDRYVLTNRIADRSGIDLQHLVDCLNIKITADSWFEKFNQLTTPLTFSPRMESLVMTLFLMQRRGKFEFMIDGKNFTTMFLLKFLEPHAGIIALIKMAPDFNMQLFALTTRLLDKDSSVYRNHLEPFIRAGLTDKFDRNKSLLSDPILNQLSLSNFETVNIPGINEVTEVPKINRKTAPEEVNIPGRLCNVSITGSRENRNSGNRETIKKKSGRPKAPANARTGTPDAFMTIDSQPFSPPTKLSRRVRGLLDVTKSIFGVFQQFAIDNKLIREEDPLMEYPFLIRLSSNDGYKRSLRQFFDSSHPNGKMKPINESGLQGLDQASELGYGKLISKEKFLAKPRGCFITTDQPYARPGDIPPNILKITEKLGFSENPRLEASYFITKKESNTPLHWDGARTLYVATRGLRVWKIFPPWFSPWITDKEASSYAREGLSLIENNFEELGEYCLTVELKEGDILIIPAGWWHLVQGKILPEDGFSAAYNIGYADPHFESNQRFYRLFEEMKRSFDNEPLTAEAKCRQLLEKAVMDCEFAGEGGRIQRNKRLK